MVAKRVQLQRTQNLWCIDVLYHTSAAAGVRAKLSSCQVAKGAVEIISDSHRGSLSRLAKSHLVVYILLMCFDLYQFLAKAKVVQN